MRITFLSCYLSPHQKPFCDEMYALLGDQFCFVETEEISAERLAMGWKSGSAKYVITAYKEASMEKLARKKTLEADAVIIGSAPDSYIVPRLKAGKLTFKYAERFYKEGLNFRNLPHAIGGAWLHHGRFQRYPLYMLCASAYTAADCAVFHNYTGRTYKWGYFPEVKTYDVDGLMKKKLSSASVGKKHPQISILWVGRLIELKHPEAIIELAEFLRKKGYAFKMSIIGIGKMETQLRNMIQDKNLGDCVEMLGAMPSNKVRAYMEQADIYLFTSDFNEGWGAVLNESMNSGCAVVASHAIGSVPFLIEDGKNGLVYENGNQIHLEKQVQRLLDDPTLRKSLGINAYQTMSSLWNAEIAAERFIELAQELLVGNDTVNLFADGPCSKAEIIKNNWFRG